MFSRLQIRFMMLVVCSATMAQTSTLFWERFDRGTWDSISFISIYTRPLQLLTAEAGRALGRWAFERISNSSFRFHWLVLMERNTSSITTFRSLLGKLLRLHAHSQFWWEATTVY